MHKTLAPRTLAAAIAARLRQDILDGKHKGGEQLRQDALAEAHGVSRIPVREALLQLEAEGLVRIAPHRGAIVSEISPLEIADVFDLRVMLEARLLRASAPRLTAHDLAEVDRLAEAFAAVLKQGNLANSGALNAEFHMALYARADLPRTSAIVAGLLQASDRYTRLQLSRSAALDRAQREHFALARLCRAGRIEEAAEALTKHIEGVRADLMRVVGSRPG
jgi:DNA-binding GntR family transcriptional regulator